MSPLCTTSLFILVVPSAEGMSLLACRRFHLSFDQDTSQTSMSTQNRRVDVPAAGKQDTAKVTSTVDSHAVTKRLQSELMSLMSATDPGVSAFPDGDSLFSWVGTIQGAAQTVYEGMSYKLSLKFPTDYPFKAPTVKFETPCFHPNVDQYGNICLDILKDKWSAAYR